MEDKLQNHIRISDYYRFYKLNLDKINSIDDCKKILKFLCDLTIKPTREGLSYSGFEDIEEYFEN